VFCGQEVCMKRETGDAFVGGDALSVRVCGDNLLE
jgi:hypothetical protein